MLFDVKRYYLENLENGKQLSNQALCDYLESKHSIKKHRNSFNRHKPKWRKEISGKLIKPKPIKKSLEPDGIDTDTEEQVLGIVESIQKLKGVLDPTFIELIEDLKNRRLKTGEKFRLLEIVGDYLMKVNAFYQPQQALQVEITNKPASKTLWQEACEEVEKERKTLEGNSNENA